MSMFEDINKIEDMKPKKFSILFLTIFKLTMHLLAIVVIIFAFLPIAKWYLNYLPVWGVDFFLSVNIASLLNQNLVFPFAVWNYAGFGGWPQFLYPIFSAYFISFLSNFYDLVLAAKIMVMVSTLLFITGSYFLFERVSKHIVLSLILAVFVGYSGGVYQTLIWAGSLPSYASQMALPWVLGFYVWFLNSKNYRLLLVSALICGLSIWIHPLVSLVYIMPSIFIINFFTFGKFSFLRKIRNLLVFAIIAFVIGFPQFYLSLDSVIKSAVKTGGESGLSTTSSSGATQTEIDIANFNKAQVKRIYTDNNKALFIFLPATAILFLVSLIISRRIRGLLGVLPFAIVAVYFSFYVWLFGQGISIYHGGWYRLLWAPPVFAGLLVSSLWGETTGNLQKLVKSQFFRLLFLFASSAFLAVFGYVFYTHGNGADSAISSIRFRSEISSAYPDVLNVKVSNKEREDLKKKILPQWVNANDTNYRLYEGDQTVNIWWNSLFKMPLARGYIDPPISPQNRGFLFLLDSGLSQIGEEAQLFKAFNYPVETAYSNTLFLIDWNAIKYFEGPHVGVAAALPVPKYLKDTLVLKEEQVDLNEHKYTKRPVSFNFSEFKEEYYSPILSGTNAPTLGIFGSVGGYENVTRALAERGNLNSQVLIGLNLGKYIDDYKYSDLANFDALYLNDYSYRNQKKAFELLRKYMESGKKVYIDTGTEVPESNGNMPGDLLPVKRVTREGQGREWQLEDPEKIYTQGIDLSKFSPPVFDENEWSISYSEPEDVTSDSKVILKNKGKVIMASRKVGRGEVIWGGFNLAYHIVRNHNYDETMLFQKILSEVVELSKKPLPVSTATFINPNKRTVKTAAKGVLFKEQAYDGWNAHLINDSGKDGKALKIFKAGPTYPGFMYVVLPNSQQMSEVKFVYSGSMQNKILIIISMIIVILLFEEVVFRGILLGRLRRLIWYHSKKRVGGWWQKEDEE